VVVGQASDFFGPCATAQSHLGERVIPPALAGKAAQLLGNPDLPHALSFVLDIGRALVALGERESAYGQVWLLPHAPAMTMRQVVELVYAEVGGTPRMSTVPPLMLRLLGLVNPLIREMQEMLYQFEEPFIVDSGKFEAAFGMTATPLPEAVRATVAWFRAR
jgi:nucleoside-diphosphate-sugar epimerase